MSLRSLRLLLVALGAGSCLSPGTLPAGDEKPFRQFPEAPEILYYEGFETSTNAWKDGKVEINPAGFPGNAHAYKLELMKNNNDKWVTANVDLPVALPGGLDAGEVHIQFNLWTDKEGNVTEMKVVLRGGDFEDKPRPAKFGAWAPISLPLSGFTKDKKRPAKDASIRQMEISLKPRVKEKPLNVYIDDVIITAGVPPANVLGKAIALENKRKDVIRAADKEGYTFNTQIQDSLQTMLKRSKGRRKPKTVMVVGASGKDTDELINGMKESVAKAKALGFTFAHGDLPDNSALAGLDDMRSFGLYCTNKTEAEVAVLVLGYADALRPGRPGDNVRVVLERALDLGCVPLVCLPPEPPGISKQDKTKLDGFKNSMANACIQLGLPWLDEGACITRIKDVKDPKDAKEPVKEAKAAKDAKDAKDNKDNKDAKDVKEAVKEAKDFKEAFDNKELSSVGLQCVATVAAEAVKHLDTYVFGRK